MHDSTRLTLQLLGEFQVARGGEGIALPASRKARALLVYLALTGRAHRRDRLCSMFWDLPDDPRGALRSSLTMLRRVVDSPNYLRILADRDTVRFDPCGVEIDLVALRAKLAGGLDSAPTEVLERGAATFRGELAEGLDLPNCPEFQAWCVAEREEARRLHIQILKTLIERHAAAPEAALPHARALVRLDAEEVSAHVALLRLLIANGRQREAEEQRELSARSLRDVRGNAAQELTRAWRTLTEKPEPVTVPEDPVTAELTGSGRADPERRRIAVLPFADLSDDAGQAYIADGITEDIITDLSRVSSLFVVDRNTAFTYKGKAVEIGEIAQKLNVCYILQGSVRRSAGRIRINVQLIGGRTGDHLWVERFDRDFQDIFSLQDEISKNVVGALRLTLLPEELKAITTRPTSNVDAYRYCLEARSLLSVSWSNKEYLRTARGLFLRAVEADPGYARAYAGIADCDAFLWVNGDLDVSYEQMLANSSRALGLAPRLAEAHASRGVALYVAGHPEEAIAAFDRAIGLDSTLFEAHFFSGLSCRDTGDFQAAVIHHRRAAELQTGNYQPLAMLADVYLALGRRDLCVAAARDCVARIEAAFGEVPKVAEVLALGAATLVYLGDYVRAESWVRQALLLDPESYTVRYNAACSFAVAGKLDIAQRYLESAFTRTPRARGWLLGIAEHDRQLDPLRERPDFQDLMKRLRTEVGS